MSSYLNLLPYTAFDPQTIDFGNMTPRAAPGMIPGMTPTAPGVGALGGSPSWLAKSGLGANMQTFNAALGGIQTLGSLWGGMKQLDLAKKQLRFTKEMSNINLGNQTKSYNTAIQDRARSRGVVEGQSQSQVDDYIARNSLDKRTIG